jgi:hypothetical protein
MRVWLSRTYPMRHVRACCAAGRRDGGEGYSPHALGRSVRFWRPLNRINRNNRTIRTKSAHFQTTPLSFPNSKLDFLTQGDAFEAVVFTSRPDRSGGGMIQVQLTAASRPAPPHRSAPKRARRPRDDLAGDAPKTPNFAPAGPRPPKGLNSLCNRMLRDEPPFPKSEKVVESRKKCPQSRRKSQKVARKSSKLDGTFAPRRAARGPPVTAP